MGELINIKDKEIQDQLQFLSPSLWAMDHELQLQGCKYSLIDHEYQKDITDSMADSIVVKKAAQLGITESFVIQNLHHQYYGIYPFGVLYLFPSETDVLDFSRTRFRPLIARNWFLSEQVKDTDSVNVKNIAGSMLFLRGGRATSRIDGIRETSSRLKSIPVDCLYVDERDEISSAMVGLAIERMGHSKIKHYREFSTPSVPNFGIDVSYNASTQNIWMVKCTRCGMETCLEKEFPDCLGTFLNGGVYRICKKCHRPIDPSNGRWVPQYPSRSVQGYYSSQLMSKMVEPKKLLDAWLHPEKQVPKTTKTEVMNSKLGLAYIESENQLTESQVRNCQCLDPMDSRHEGPCAMGVDVGAKLHVLIGLKTDGNFKKILRVAKVDSFNDVHDLAADYNVQVAVFDKYPETHKVREFLKAEKFDGYTCEYSETLTTSEVWNVEESQVKVNRTEILDQSDRVIRNRNIELPRSSDIMEEFVKHAVSNVKKLERKKTTDTPIYRYIQRGDDHFRHALNYFLLACTRVNEYRRGKYYSDLPRNAGTSASYLRI